ncbi:hypothetical protein ACYPKM_00505 [Pseudomonas aeruginosa]
MSTEEMLRECWYEELCGLARQHGINVSDEEAWMTSYELNQSPLEALAEEYPHILENSEEKALPPPATVADIIGIPLERWPGNCYGIAMAMVECGVVKGKYIYGHYHGSVSPNCTMFYGKPIIQHGWITLENGDIIDPTRWVFEDRTPYFFRTTAEKSWEYDLGGNRYRAKSAKPKPDYSLEDNQCEVGESARPLFSRWLQREVVGAVSFPELMWLANTSLHHLKDDAKPIYEEIVRMNWGALIPVDNRMHVLNEALPKSRRMDFGPTP